MGTGQNANSNPFTNPVPFAPKKVSPSRFASNARVRRGPEARRHRCIAPIATVAAHSAGSQVPPIRALADPRPDRRRSTGADRTPPGERIGR